MLTQSREKRSANLCKVGALMAAMMVTAGTLSLQTMTRAEPTNLSGVYRVTAIEEHYAGQVTLRKQGAVYTISWRLTNGDSYSGIAIQQGNTLSANWKSHGAEGVVVYTVLEHGRVLAGSYAAVGHTNVDHERLTRQ